LQSIDLFVFTSSGNNTRIIGYNHQSGRNKKEEEKKNRQQAHDEVHDEAHDNE